MEFIEIERERMKHKIPVGQLCNAAGMTESNYFRIRKGAQVPQADTLARLVAGLASARKGEKPIKSELLFRLVLGWLAVMADMDLVTVMRHDPQQKATADPKWMEISKMRAMACYVLKTVLGLPNAEVARAARISQPAVTIAIQKLEVKRDDPALDQFFNMLELAVSG